MKTVMYSHTHLESTFALHCTQDDKFYNGWFITKLDTPTPLTAHVFDSAIQYEV